MSRYAFAGIENQFVALVRELEFVSNYLEVEKVRFANRLRVELPDASDAEDIFVPVLSLQPLIENAIRHGIANCEGEGTVETSARREGDRLHICVRDSGPGAPWDDAPADRTGPGAAKASAPPSATRPRNG